MKPEQPRRARLHAIATVLAVTLGGSALAHADSVHIPFKFTASGSIQIGEAGVWSCIADIEQTVTGDIGFVPAGSPISSSVQIAQRVTAVTLVLDDGSQIARDSCSPSFIKSSSADNFTRTMPLDYVDFDQYGTSTFFEAGNFTFPNILIRGDQFTGSDPPYLTATYEYYDDPGGLCCVFRTTIVSGHFDSRLEPLQISPSPLPDATVGQYYHVCLTASGGVGPPYQFVGGNFPTGNVRGHGVGLEMVGPSTGRCIDGLPETPLASLIVQVTVTDRAGNNRTQDLFLTIHPTTPLKQFWARLSNQAFDHIIRTPTWEEVNEFQDDPEQKHLENIVLLPAAFLFKKLAGDPPDPNFTLVAQPIPLSFTALSHGWPSDVEDAFDALLRLESNMFGYERAILASVERAQGADAARSVYWSNRQRQAAAEYGELLSQAMRQYSACAEQFSIVYAGAGLPPVVVTVADMQAFQSSVAAGLPDWLLAPLGQAGLTDVDLVEAQHLLMAASIPTVDVSLFDSQSQLGDVLNAVAPQIAPLADLRTAATDETISTDTQLSLTAKIDTSEEDMGRDDFVNACNGIDGIRSDATAQHGITIPDVQYQAIVIALAETTQLCSSTAPTVTGIVPNAGPSAGGTTATITGIGFAADATVTFGGAAATDVVVESWTSITASVPAHTAGSVDVVVTNPDTQSGTSTNGFTYLVPPTATVAAVPGTIATGAVLTITWQNIAGPRPTDWLALIPTGALDTSWVAWKYTTGTTGGSTTMAVPAFVQPGSYDLRLFAHDSLQRLAVSSSITVAAATIAASPATILPGETVTATWASIGAPTTSDWIALVPTGANDASYVRWGYTTGAVGGSQGLVLPASTPPGTYELRLFAQDSWRRLAVSNTITVPTATLTASPGTVAPGGTLTVGWSSVGTPTALDWLALEPLNAPDGSYVAWTLATGRSGDSTRLALPANLAAGSYEVRMFANNTFKHVAVSNGITVTVPGPSLSASPAVVAPSGNVTVDWQNITSPSPTDWVGVYAAGDPDASFVTRFYTGGRANDGALTALPANLLPGSYELRLFANDTLTRLTTSNGFMVAAGPGVSVSPKSVASGGTLAATWTGIASPTTTDWVALVPVDAADTGYVDWRYTTGSASGNLGLPIPASVPAGTYELRLFAQDTLRRLAVSNAVTVGPTLTVTPTPVAPGGSVTVTWAGIPAPTTTDWLAVVPINAPDTSYTAWVYANGRAGDSTLLVLPWTLPAGAYDARLFARDTFVRLAISNILTVTAPGPVLTATPVIAAGGTTLTVNWQGIAAPTANDWIGVYVAGAADAAFLSQTFTNGQSSGSTSIPLSTGLAAGTYELRLFANNTLTRLAVSNGFAVGSGAVVRVSPANAATGSTLKVNWEGIATPTATDWVALVPLDGPDGSYVAWVFTAGTADGSVALSLPGSVPTGTYELRLFANNTFTHLAISNVVTIRP